VGKASSGSVPFGLLLFGKLAVKIESKSGQMRCRLLSRPQPSITTPLKCHLLFQSFSRVNPGFPPASEIAERSPEPLTLAVYKLESDQNLSAAMPPKRSR
jgi:predicted component of type VI protein secretion system